MSEQAPKNRRKGWGKRAGVLALLLALSVAAALLGPDLIEWGQSEDPAVEPAAPTVQMRRSNQHGQQDSWRWDLSLGPLLEMLEQALDLEPFDLRRPVRIPFHAPPRPVRDNILLADPAGFRPNFIPARSIPLPPTPGQPSSTLGFTGGGYGLGSGGGGGSPPEILSEEEDYVVTVPEPGSTLLLGSLFAAFGLARRRFRSS